MKTDLRSSRFRLIGGQTATAPHPGRFQPFCPAPWLPVRQTQGRRWKSNGEKGRGFSRSAPEQRFSRDARSGADDAPLLPGGLALLA